MSTSVKPAPTGSLACDVQEHETLISAEPLGAMRGSYGLILVGPGIIFVPLVIMWRGGGWNEVETGVQLWLGTLGLAGLILTLFAYHAGKTRTVIRLGKTTLTVTRRSPLFKHRTVVERGDIAEIHVGEAPFTAGNKPINRLEIVNRAGHKLRCLTSRPESDLAWAVSIIADWLEAA